MVLLNRNYMLISNLFYFFIKIFLFIHTLLENVSNVLSGIYFYVEICVSRKKIVKEINSVTFTTVRWRYYKSSAFAAPFSKKLQSLLLFFLLVVVEFVAAEVRLRQIRGQTNKTWIVYDLWIGDFWIIDLQFKES